MSDRVTIQISDDTEIQIASLSMCISLSIARDYGYEDALVDAGLSSSQALVVAKELIEAAWTRLPVSQIDSLIAYLINKRIAMRDNQDKE